jgi:hypothetical protein
MPNTKAELSPSPRFPSRRNGFQDLEMQTLELWPPRRPPLPGDTSDEKQQDIPHFEYSENFAEYGPRSDLVALNEQWTNPPRSGQTYHGISAGGGRFVDYSPQLPSHDADPVVAAPAFTFSVDKDRIEGTIAVTIHSSSLRLAIAEALDPLGIHYPGGGGFCPSVEEGFPLLLENYEALKERHLYLEAHARFEYATREFCLLVVDFLLDRAVFEGIEIPRLQSSYGNSDPLTPTHLHDIHSRIFDAGLDEIDDCFALGSLHAEAEGEYISSMTDQYTRFALSGQSAQLYQFCEPLLDRKRSGLNAHARSFLSDPLANETLDVYGSLDGPVSRLGLNDSPGGHLGSAPVSELFSGVRDVAFGSTHTIEIEDGRSGLVPSYGLGAGAFVEASVGHGPANLGYCSGRRPPQAATAIDTNPNRSVALSSPHHGAREGPDFSHLKQQKIGRNIISALAQLCLKIRATCESAPQGIMMDAAFPAQYVSLAHVWYRGLAVFRNILNNRPPRQLMETFDCLLVASSLCAVIPDNEWMRRQFENDLDSWRSVLDAAACPLFDRIAGALWNYSPDDGKVRKTDLGDWFEFTELLQDIVSTDRVDSQHATAPYLPFSTRLSAMQSQHCCRPSEDDDGRAGPLAIPGGNSSGTRAGEMPVLKRTWQDSFVLTPDSGPGFFSMDDFFDVEKFLSQSVESEKQSGASIEANIDLFLKDILRPTAHQLASVAYAIIFTFMIGL